MVDYSTPSSPLIKKEIEVPDISQVTYDQVTRFNKEKLFPYFTELEKLKHRVESRGYEESLEFGSEKVSVPVQGKTSNEVHSSATI